MHIYFKYIVDGSERKVRMGGMHKWSRNFTQNFKRIFAVHRLLDNILLYMQREMRSDIYIKLYFIAIRGRNISQWIWNESETNVIISEFSRISELQISY